MTDSCLVKLGDPYIKLCSQVKPGDVLAFATCDLPANVVKLATHSAYVHVAIVLSVTTNNNHADPVLIAESHINLTLPSEGTGKKQLGVQFQRLSQRMVACNGTIWWAALKQPLRKKGLNKMRSWLRDVEAKAVPYDFYQAVKVGVDILVAGGGLGEMKSFERVTSSIETIVKAIAKPVNVAKPTKASVTFGVELEVWQGALIAALAKGTGKTSVEIMLEWLKGN